MVSVLKIVVTKRTRIERVGSGNTNRASSRVEAHKFSADEVLAVFSKGEAAAAATLALRAAVEPVLGPHGLAAGIGVHVGPVVEGLYGAQEIKAYDVLGDAVNTAKRVEGAAAGGEVLLTEAAVALLPRAQRHGAWRQVTVKGKRLPLRVLAAA